jgi:hypothetical protein
MGYSSERRCREWNYRDKNRRDYPKDMGSGLSAVTSLVVHAPGTAGMIYSRGVPERHKRLNEVAKWAKNPCEEHIEEDHSRE